MNLPNPSSRQAEGREDAAASRPTRRLIWIPIVHSQADLGSLGDSIRDVYARRFGTGTWEERIKAVDELWQRIGVELERLDLDCPRVRLYQDGLPNCGHEAAIVRDLARAGSQNHQLLEALMARGARIDAFYYCPHYDLSEIPRYRLDCPCRKPKPEMARRAAAELGLDLSRSYMIGDKVEDVEFGLAAGLRPILVRTGYGASAEIKLVERAITPAAVAGTLLEAVDWILEHDPERR